MKVIFLDFDGVLNSRSMVFKHAEEDRKYDLYEEHLEVLDWIMSRVPDVFLVITSTWRFSYTLRELRRMMYENGLRKEFASRVISKTNRVHLDEHSRGSEIHNWLENNKKLESFVIIDDYPIYGPKYLEKENFLRTDNSYGLTYYDGEQAVSILNNTQMPVILL